MRFRKTTIAVCVPLVACVAFGASLIWFKSGLSHTDSQGGAPMPDSNQTTEWSINTDYGVRIMIAANLTSGNLARTIYVFMETEDATEENLKRVFTGLAAEYSSPYNLVIHCFSDKNAITEELRQLNSTAVFVRKNSGNIGHYRAIYDRKGGEESMVYRPDPKTEDTIRIVLKEKVIAYSGNVDRDLLLAIEEGDTNKARTLLEIGANVNAVDAEGWNALILAVLYDPKIARHVLRKTRDIDHRDNAGWTALMHAAASGETALARELLDRRANVNAKNEHGDTPLILAVCRGHEDVVKLLLSRGADVNATESRGLTALSLLTIPLCGSAQPSMLRLLREAGGR